MNKARVAVVGLGEVGSPLFELLSKVYDVIGIDIDSPTNEIGQIQVLHICYPFQVKDFVGETVRYIKLFRPGLTIINSTVAVGTTRQVAKLSDAHVVYSPVRGKHGKMVEDLMQYRKFVGGTNLRETEVATRHFELIGMKVKALSSPEAAELAKLTETTFYGLLIAWAQEVERYSDQCDLDYDEVISFYDEIAFFPPVKYFPGIIGGHCVMPNIEILSQLADSVCLKAIRLSNNMKIEREHRRKGGRNIAKTRRAIAIFPTQNFPLT